MGEMAPKVVVCSSKDLRLYPYDDKFSIRKPRTVHLSILDATVVKYDTTSAIWFYESADTLSHQQLKRSLRKTLSFHPWLTGRLHWAHSSSSPFDASTHSERFRRLAITYFSKDTDPGAVFTTASCDTHDLIDIIPPPNHRSPVSDPTSTGWTSEDFLPDLTRLALHSFPDLEGCCFATKVTRFRCGGTAIGVAFSHQIADALTMTNFMHDWSRVHAAMVGGDGVPQISPWFQPSLLDAKATGDIDAMVPDKAVVSRARNLPMLRYDFWAENDGKTLVDRLPPELKAQPELLPSHDTLIPWSSWDRNAAVSYRVLHFTYEQIEKIHQAASDASQSTSVTRHDAVVAHVWRCINIARAPLLSTEPDAQVLLTMTLGIRARLSLPPTFVGSPIITTYLSRPAKTFFQTSPVHENNQGSKPNTTADIASDINRTQKLFTPLALGDALHDAAFEVCPHRLWQTMLGTRHVLSTSWIHTHVYDDMDFGCKRRSDDGSVTAVIPWYVHPGVGKPDGIVLVFEARPRDAVETSDKWYRRGVDVGVSLQSSVMEGLLSSDILGKY